MKIPVLMIAGDFYLQEKLYNRYIALAKANYPDT